MNQLGLIHEMVRILILIHESIHIDSVNQNQYSPSPCSYKKSPARAMPQWQDPPVILTIWAEEMPAQIWNSISPKPVHTFFVFKYKKVGHISKSGEFPLSGPILRRPNLQGG